VLPISGSQPAAEHIIKVGQHRLVVLLGIARLELRTRILPYDDDTANQLRLSPGDFIARTTFVSDLGQRTFQNCMRLSRDFATSRDIPRDLIRFYSGPVKIDIAVFSKEIPYAGLINRVAACYLNSTLQYYFHLPRFRALVKEMPENSPLSNAFRDLFGEMETSTNAVLTPY
jgi:hypothetical protein